MSVKTNRTDCLRAERFDGSWSMAAIRDRGARVAIVLAAACLLAACDKCGAPVKFNAPSLPSSCGANADPGR
jgi:hypothetical protein